MATDSIGDEEAAAHILTIMAAGSVPSLFFFIQERSQELADTKLQARIHSRNSGVGPLQACAAASHPSPPPRRDPDNTRL